MSVESHHVIEGRKSRRWFWISLRPLPADKRAALMHTYNWLVDIESQMEREANRSGGAGVRDVMVRIHESAMSLKTDRPFDKPIASALAGVPNASARVIEFADAVGQRLLRTPFRAQIDLDQYCARYGGSFARMCAGVLGLPDDIAKQMGTAGQRVRLVSEFAYLNQQGWVPLPLAEAGISNEDIQLGLRSEAVRKALSTQLDLSEAAMSQLTHSVEAIREPGTAKFIRRWGLYYQLLARKARAAEAKGLPVNLSSIERFRVLVSG